MSSYTKVPYYFTCISHNPLPPKNNVIIYKYIAIIISIKRIFMNISRTFYQ